MGEGWTAACIVCGCVLKRRRHNPVINVHSMRTNILLRTH